MVTTNHTLSHISRMEDSNLNHHSNPNPHTNSSNSNSNTVHSNSSLSFPTKYFRAEGTTRTGNNNNNNYMIAPRKRSLELMTRLNDLDLDGSVGCLTPQTMTEGGMAFPQTPLMKDCATPTLSQSLLRTPSNYYQTMKRPQQLMRASQDALELSQVNTEYSTFFARRILTDYREVRELGRGAFGRVSLYEEVSSGSLVAVKYSGPLWSSDLERRYRRERSVLNLVRGLPHVVELTAAWEESCEVGEGRPATAMYLQLEYCPGGSVAGVAAARREQQQPWLEEELLTFLAHMVIALHALHSRQIAHVDFKPDNILLDAQQQYKLSDFGCSVLLDDEGRPRREEWYTNNNNKEMDLQEVGPQWSCASVDEGDCRYLCSDMLNGKTHLTAGDMFSLGVTLYELMSGRPLPKNGDEFLQLRRQIPTAFLQQRGYSDRLIHVVASLMADDPTARPTAQQLLLYLRPSPVQCQLLADRELLTQTAVQYAQADRPKEMERELRYLAAVSEATTYFLQTLLAGDLAPPNTHGAPMRSQAPKNGNREEACTPVNQPDPHGVSW
ncbi:Protein kinase domain/Protein tyrosine kinase, putative [Angomonas deanei]|uniref:Protein kinase domain/Protein tyrosine kinase, putative n=1 Tax=Angomonas deanei TaxID=59799 RepID=A0A7G2C8D2_9TRYP|nr:Protein kinase domain/Protein tyrosine kinase, putative [Angomonas deanei]